MVVNAARTSAVNCCCDGHREVVESNARVGLRWAWRMSSSRSALARTLQDHRIHGHQRSLMWHDARTKA
jgi:hypothetical protein